VVHTPAANCDAVAEFVFALLFDALRPRLFLDGAVELSRWNAMRRELEAHAQFNELSMGILGMGRVGSRVARIARGLGMRTRYFDLAEIAPEGRHGAEPVDLTTLLRDSDVLTVHIDNRPGNAKIVGEAYYSLLRPTAVVVNTSRGSVLDERALAAFLRDHPAARALLDVHDPEPFGEGYPLIGLPNAFLSPHLAASTAAAQAGMSWVVKDVWRVLVGQRPEHPAP